MADTPLVGFPLERVNGYYGLLAQHSRPLGVIYQTSIHGICRPYFFGHHGRCPLSLTGPLGNTQFAPPRVIQTSNGVHFTRNMFKELTKLLHVTNYYTIRYHPQVNGLIEHTNRVVKSALTSLVSDRLCT